MPQDNIAIVEKQFPNDKFLPEVVRLLDEGYTVTLRLKGYSMRPFLENNRDKALLVKARDIKKGDPVLAEISPGHYVLHRGDTAWRRQSDGGEVPNGGRQRLSDRFLQKRTRCNGSHRRHEMAHIFIRMDTSATCAQISSGFLPEDMDEGFRWREMTCGIRIEKKNNKHNTYNENKKRV